MSQPPSPFAPLAAILPPEALLATMRRPARLAPDPLLAGLPFLFWLIDSAAPRLAVGLGISGVVHAALAQGMEALGPGHRAIGLALPPDAGATGKGEGDVLSPATAEAFDLGSIGLLHLALPLDEPALEAVERLWLPRLAEGGVLVLQGIAAQTLSAEVRARLRRWQGAFPFIEHPEGEGLLVLLAGPVQPDRLLALAELRLGMAGHEELRQIFACLGRLIETEARLAMPDAPPPPADLLAVLTRAAAEAQEVALQQRETAARLKAELARREAGQPERLAETEAMLARARSEILALRDRERQAVESLALARREAEDLARLAAERGQAHAQILASTSWRLTGPLRRAVLLTRRRPPPDDAAL